MIIRAILFGMEIMQDISPTLLLTYGQNYYIKSYNYNQRACDYKITTT